MENDVVAGGDLTDAATMIAEERSHGVPVLRGRTEHETTRCFVDKRSERVESVQRHHDRHAEPRCDRHLADGNRKAALTAVVGRGDLAVADARGSPGNAAVDRRAGWARVALRSKRSRSERAAECTLVRADQPEVVTDCIPAESTAWRRSGTRPSAEISKVPGIASPSNSLNSESLPEMNGIR